MEQLYIHLAEPSQWLIWHPGQQEIIASGVLTTHQELAQLSEQAQRCDVTALVPGQDVLLTEVRLPAGSQRLLPQLVPNALEDELASDIETLHFAWPANAKPAGVDKPMPVVVVSKARMQYWLEVLAAAGIDCEQMVPDYFVLPVQEGGVQLQLGQACLVRDGQWQAYTVDQPPLIATEATDITEQFEVPLQVVRLGQAQQGINLRQGDYRAQRKRRTQNFALPWKPVAVAASLAVIAVVAQQVLTYIQLGQQNEALQQAIETTYKETFPETTRIVNVRSQLRQKLASIGQSDAAGGASTTQAGLSMLAELTPAFRAVPDVELELLRYNNAVLSLQVNASSFDTLQQFQTSATAAGLSVNQGQVTNRNGVVSGNIEVRKKEG